MLKIPLKLSLRKIKKYKYQYLGISILIAVGLAFFLILATIKEAYEEETLDFFDTYAYADLTMYGSFSDADEQIIDALFEDANVQARYVFDQMIDQQTIRWMSITEDINELYFYEGTYPSEGEVVLQKKFAEEKQLSVGQSITIDDVSYEISGIVTSPEHVYLVKNEQSFMLSGADLGIIYVDHSFFTGSYQEILIHGDLSTDKINQLKQLYPHSLYVNQEQQINYQLFRADLEQIETFFVIFPTVFFMLIILMIYVMISRSVTEERRQVGIYKALGYQTKRVIWIYLFQILLITTFGILLSFILTYGLTNVIIKAFSAMFEVPNLSFKFYPMFWLISIVILVILNTTFCMLSLFKIVKQLPARLLRPAQAKHRKLMIGDRILKLFSGMSFNSKYAVKSMMRNKPRFLTMIAGMSGTLTLLIFAFSFYDSIGYTKEIHFDDFVAYDASVSFEPMMLNDDHISMTIADDYDKVLTIPVILDDEIQKVMIIENDFKAMDIDVSSLESGVMLPRYLAEQLEVNVGDIITLDEYQFRVSKIVDQHFNLSIFVLRSYIESVTGTSYGFYNTLYIRTTQLNELEDLKENHPLTYQTVVDEKKGFDSIMESLEGLIWFMLGASVILGAVVMLSMGQMNLTSRMDEYIFLRAVGYPDHKITLIGIKELIVQFMLSAGLAVYLSNLVIIRVAFEFSSKQFVLAVSTSYVTYILSFLIGVVLSCMTMIYSKFYISDLDIVESMKMREDTF
jgi:putative ABC transport system permease protein